MYDRRKNVTRRCCVPLDGCHHERAHLTTPLGIPRTGKTELLEKQYVGFASDDSNEKQYAPPAEVITLTLCSDCWDRMASRPFSCVPCTCSTMAAMNTSHSRIISTLLALCAKMPKCRVCKAKYTGCNY